MKPVHLLFTLIFGVAVVLFFGLAYPHHLHYQEQYQLFLFDSAYVWDIMRVPGGVADLLGRFCTQFFLFAWVGAVIIALLLVAIQLLTLRLTDWGRLYGLTFVPSFLLWLFLLDENALLGGVWAVLLLLLACWMAVQLSGRMRIVAILVAIPVLYWIASPAGHYYRNPSESPLLLWAAMLSVLILVPIARACHRWIVPKGTSSFFTFLPSYLFTFLPSYLFTFLPLLPSYLLTFLLFSTLVWKNANFKAERVMQYDFMARYQQWNRILDAIDDEQPNNQIGVTVQNLALAMRGSLVEHLFDYHQNGTAGLLPDFASDATSPLPTAEVFYQLGMISVAQRWVFEAQEAILDFQKSARCYKRLAETNLINGSYTVARKYLMALQKTLFYREWANATLPLLSDEAAIAHHPEYGHLRQMNYQEDFYFGGHVPAEMLESLYHSNPDNRLALEYLRAYYLLTGDRENFMKLKN